MDAIAMLLARKDPATLLYVMAAYLIPLLLYCVSSALAFLALAERPGSPARVLARSALVFALPILGALVVLADLGRGARSPR